jgi:hypothetical protein
MIEITVTYGQALWLLAIGGALWVVGQFVRGVGIGIGKAHHEAHRRER